MEKEKWTKKCTCENFQQNEDCEHIGNKILEEVGMQVEDSMGSYHIANTHIEEVGLGVGDKDCPDCKVDVGCAKHYFQNGDRHDRLKGALTPLGQRLYKPISPPVKIFYCQKCGQQLHPSIDEEWFDMRSGEKSCNFVWRCPNRGWNNNLLNTFWKPHTTVKTAEDGTELSEYSGM